MISLFTARSGFDGLRLRPNHDPRKRADRLVRRRGFPARGDPAAYRSNAPKRIARAYWPKRIRAHINHDPTYGRGAPPELLGREGRRIHRRVPERRVMIPFALHHKAMRRSARSNQSLATTAMPLRSTTRGGFFVREKLILVGKNSL